MTNPSGWQGKRRAPKRRAADEFQAYSWASASRVLADHLAEVAAIETQAMKAAGI